MASEPFLEDKLWRYLGSGLYFLAALILMLFNFSWTFWASLFTVSLSDPTESGLVWTIAWVLIGVAGSAYDSAKTDHHGERGFGILTKYLTRYLLGALLLALLVFGILHSISAIGTVQFFYIAAPVGAACGYAIDRFLDSHGLIHGLLKG